MEKTRRHTAYAFIATDISVLFLFAALFGVLNFATFPVIANIVATHIGLRVMGLTLGLLFGGHSLGAAIGVMLGGWIFDLTARYDGLWWIALAGFFALLVPERRAAAAA